jgi:hypothetical protein
MAAPKIGGISLGTRLREALPNLLPPNPTDAITGTQIIEKLQSQGFSDYSENSLRQYLSDLSKDSTSPIAKVDKGHGYFGRDLSEVVGSKTSLKSVTPASVSKDHSARDFQLEEKFRSLFMRWSELEGRSPVHLEHTRSAKQLAGINKWKFPDVIDVEWKVPLDENGKDFIKNILDVMRGLGEQPFKITSTELKVEVRASTLREIFFQCVSNSRWAHAAQLVVASDIQEQLVVDELKRLGSSYRISVLSFGLSSDKLEKMPPAGEILDMAQGQLEELLNGVQVKVIATGEEQEQLDWDQLRDLQNQISDIDDILAWIARCLNDGRAYSFKRWQKSLK